LNRRFSSTIRKFVFAAFLVVVSGAQASDDRADALGNGLICMCSCGQLLSGCEMVNCPSAPKLRAELKKHIGDGENDKTILASFSAKYGPKILSAPPTSDWFNLSAWVMPFIALLAGGIAAVFFVKHFRSTRIVEGPAPVEASKYESEIEEELRNLTPED